MTFSHVLRGLSTEDLEAGMVSTRRNHDPANAFADCPIIPAQRDFRAPLAFNAP